MLREFLANTPHAGWALAAFILFFLVFMGVLGYLLRGIFRHRSYDREASLPLDDEGHEPHGGSVS